MTQKAEFKKGDLLRRNGNPNGRMPNEVEATVSEVLGDGYLRFDGYETDTFHEDNFELVSAEIDPSKIRKGDTVTATVTPLGDNDGPKPFEIKGEIYTDPFDDVLMVGAFRLSEENVTITDHQPAPEPKWRRRTVWVDQHGTWYLAGTYNESPRLYADDGAFVVSPKDGLRELVAIDPADEKFDQDSLAEVARKAYNSAPDVVEWETVANAIRTHLGIEKS